MGRRRTRYLLQADCVGAIVAEQQLLHTLLVVFPVNSAETLLIVRYKQHPARGRADACERECLNGFHDRSYIEAGNMVHARRFIWRFSDADVAAVCCNDHVRKPLD